MPSPGILLLIQNYLVGTIKEMPAAELADVREKSLLVFLFQGEPGGLAQRGGAEVAGGEANQ